MDTDQILAITFASVFFSFGVCCLGYIVFGTCRYEKKQDVLLEQV